MKSVVKSVVMSVVGGVEHFGRTWVGILPMHLRGQDGEALSRFGEDLGPPHSSPHCVVKSVVKSVASVVMSVIVMVASTLSPPSLYTLHCWR